MTQRKIDLFLDILYNMTQMPELKLSEDFSALQNEIYKYLNLKFPHVSEKQIDINTMEQMVLLRYLVQNPNIFGGSIEKQKDANNTYRIIHKNSYISSEIQAINHMNAIQQDRWVNNRFDQIAVIDVDTNSLRFLTDDVVSKRLASKLYCDFLTSPS